LKGIYRKNHSTEDGTPSMEGNFQKNHPAEDGTPPMEGNLQKEPPRRRQHPSNGGEFTERTTPPKTAPLYWRGIFR